MDLHLLADRLRETGHKVEVGEAINHPFFPVEGKVLRLNESDVQVFEFPDARSALRQARLISADGGTIGTNAPFWIAPPHFYSQGRIIALYLGDDKATQDALSSVLGASIAGAKKK